MKLTLVTGCAMIKWHTVNDVFKAFYNQSHSKCEIQLACIKGPRNRTFEACISILIRKCSQRCLILSYANLWGKKNIPLFYKHVATYKNCPKTALILKLRGKSKWNSLYILKDISRLQHNRMPADTERSAV